MTEMNRCNKTALAMHIFLVVVLDNYLGFFLLCHVICLVSFPKNEPIYRCIDHVLMLFTNAYSMTRSGDSLALYLSLCLTTWWHSSNFLLTAGWVCGKSFTICRYTYAYFVYKLCPDAAKYGSISRTYWRCNFQLPVRPAFRNSRSMSICMYRKHRSDVLLASMRFFSSNFCCIGGVTSS